MGKGSLEGADVLSTDCPHLRSATASKNTTNFSALSTKCEKYCRGEGLFSGLGFVVIVGGAGEDVRGMSCTDPGRLGEICSSSTCLDVFVGEDGELSEAVGVARESARYDK